MLTGAFLIILLSLAAIIPPLRYNKLYILNTALVVGSAYLFENNVYVIKNIFKEFYGVTPKSYIIKIV